MPQEIIVTFDYEVLDAETRIVVQQKTGEIKERVGNIARNWIEIGKRLSEVKAKLPYKQWGKWLEAEFGWSQDTAENWMRTAAWLDQNPNSSDSAKLLPQRVLYLLSGKSIPESARDEILTQAAEGKPVTTKAAQQIIASHKPQPPQPEPQPAPKPAEPPKHWMDTLIIGKHYPVDRKRGVVIDEPFDSNQDCRAAYPGLRPESTAYMRNNKVFFTMYRFVTPEPATPSLPTEAPAPEGQALHAAGIDDSTSPDEPTAPALTIQPDKWYPVKHTEHAIYCDPFDSQKDGAADPRYQGHAIQHGKNILAGIATHAIYANYQLVEPKDQPASPRHDPRVVSNAGEWTPGEVAYMHRAQAAVNHAHPGKMPFAGNPLDEIARLRARNAELEAENTDLRTENTRLKAEVVNLRKLAELPDVKQPPVERTH